MVRISYLGVRGRGMDRATIQKAVEEAVQEIQKISGRGPIRLTLDTVVLNPDFGFTSLNGLETCCRVEEILGIEIKDRRSVFFDRDEQRATTLAECVDRIAKSIEKGEQRSG
jgi:hypothetical protein